MDQFSAAPSALGYMYQCELALLEFLRRDDFGLELSIEVLDDIAFEGEQTELIQTKYQVTPGSLTDGSTDLWKTLRIWSEAATTQPKALLVLVTTATAASESIAALLRADSGRNPDAAHDRLVTYARSTSSRTLQSARDAFLGLPDDQRADLVRRIVISDGAPAFGDLEEQFDRALRIAAPPNRRRALSSRLREWWLARAEQHLVEVASGTHPRISAAEIEERLAGLRDELSADNLPIDFEEIDPPTEEQVAEERRAFVMQLRLIALSNSRIRLAIHDHNRAFSQRSRWLREDLVAGDELRRYETRLKDEWERLWLPETEEEEELSEAEAAERGRGVYRACEDAPIEPIRPKVSAPHIMRGSFHMLADELKIGWHHEWLDRMQAVLEGSQ